MTTDQYSQGATSRAIADGNCAIEARDLEVYYGNFRALKGVSLKMHQRKITAFIGPSGCGKSTLLRAFNRMNDLIPNTRISGQVLYRRADIYDRSVDPVDVRRRIGMVFQKPNPFLKTIYDNVAWGARINGYRGKMDELVEHSLRQAVLWDEVKDKLSASALALSGGQQQRLCIARAIAIQPDIILAIACGVDEAAPLLFTVLGNDRFEIGQIVRGGVRGGQPVGPIIGGVLEQPTDTLTLLMYRYSRQPYPERLQQARTMALAVMLSVRLGSTLCWRTG